jgi:hypothetical protein
MKEKKIRGKKFFSAIDGIRQGRQKGKDGGWFT